MNKEKFIEIIEKIDKDLEVIERDKKFEFNYWENIFNLEYEKFNEIIAEKDKRTTINTILYNENSYEVLLNFENNRRIPFSIMVRENKIEMIDSQNKIEYSVSRPSDEYLLFLIEHLYNENLFNDFLHSNYYPSRHVRNNMEDVEDVFDFMRKLFRRMYTLKIKTENDMKINKFLKLSNSTIFHIAYNLEIPVVEIKNFDEFLNMERIHRIRRNNSSEMEAPKRNYKKDLVYHYQMAISSDSAFLQYISFYHIIEHFLEKIYNEELISLLQNELSHPEFSLKRENDVRKIIKIINKKLSIRKEELVINEKEAVKLTIDKYVKTENLVDNLNEYNDELVDYYKDKKVIFSGGHRVNLLNPNRQQIISNLAKRIYYTRNSIVHSKDIIHSKGNNKPKYVPFKHDKHLIKEIPLIRFVAEDIILNTSEII
ncbi:hypothetical protein HSACCH_01478 [Halanaerobium saccharolyticum subsp. saccharolyticum DSM 6643]|uniref:Uncharacterized protein n=1 Tax=Halanaerobium saccharolyticum subsp. saccharolyticum DSM 6643 TaxID=1293054 RepID=M5E1D1_9FIRM|nr:hypothetical protein [Halanaerobium saccharolyticum]CCU79641.1 hypothetical protein HSACCH_01478 [Halanaerobium saccharolyticum subsp. saccharolyticum DSM 6643]